MCGWVGRFRIDVFLYLSGTEKLRYLAKQPVTNDVDTLVTINNVGNFFAL